MIDAATFVANYPEFAEMNTALPAQVTRALRVAATFCDAPTWGERYVDAVMLRAALNLARSPFGESARLKDGSIVYEAEWKAMLRALPTRMATT